MVWFFGLFSFEKLFVILWLVMNSLKCLVMFGIVFDVCVSGDILIG